MGSVQIGHTYLCTIRQCNVLSTNWSYLLVHNAIVFCFSLNEGKFDLINECNTKCYCQEVKYNPICSYDNIQFYSACHAGCTMNDISDEEVSNGSDC